MRSKDKLQIVAKPFDLYGGKHWVKVTLLLGNNSFVPSFEDLFRIVQAICHCEDEKYPNGRGRLMVRDFMADSCAKDANWEQLKEKYGIPTRE